MELRDVELRAGARGIGKSLRDHRTSTARAFRQADFISRRLQQRRGRDADLGIIEVDESVVEKDHLSGDFGFGTSDFGFAVLKPGFKRLSGERRELASGVDSRD